MCVYVLIDEHVLKESWFPKMKVWIHYNVIYPQWMYVGAMHECALREAILIIWWFPTFILDIKWFSVYFHSGYNIIRIPSHAKEERTTTVPTKRSLIAYPYNNFYIHNIISVRSYTILIIYIMSRGVSAHGHLKLNCDFGLHGGLYTRDITFICLYRSCYIDPLKCTTWALTRECIESPDPSMHTKCHSYMTWYILP